MNREIVGGGGATIYPLVGDVTSTAGNTTVSVTGIQGISVPPQFPVGGEVLTYDGPTNTLLLEQPAQQVELETNGTANSTQSLLNITGSGGVVVTESGGTVTINGSGAGGFTTKNNFNITGRDFVSTYVNTTGSTMFVSCAAELVGGSGGDFLIQAFTGPAGSPLLVQSNTCTSTIGGHATNGISFMVLNGESYNVTVTDLSGAGVYSPGAWTEWS